MYRILLSTFLFLALPALLFGQDAPAEVDSFQPTKYVVQKGDNLYRIAVNHNVTLNELVEVNNFQPGETNIFVGQEILIPPPGSLDNETETLKEQQELGYYSWKKKQLEAQVEAEEAIKDSLHKEEVALKELLSKSETDTQSVDSSSEEQLSDMGPDPELAAKLAEIDSLKRLLEVEIAEKEELKRQLSKEQSRVSQYVDSSQLLSSPDDIESVYALYEAVEVEEEEPIEESSAVETESTVEEIEPESIEYESTDTVSLAVKAIPESSPLDASIKKAEQRAFAIEADISSIRKQQKQLESEAEKEANTPINNDDINAILARVEAAKLRSQKEDELEDQLKVKEEELIKAKAEWNVLLRQKEMQVAGLAEPVEEAEIPETPKEASPTDNPVESSELASEIDSASTEATPGIHKSKEEGGLVTEMFIAGSTATEISEEEGKKGRDKIKNKPTEPIDFESTVFPVEEVTIADEKNSPDEIDSTSMIKAEFFLARALGEIDQENYKAAEKYIDKSLKLNPEYLAAIMLHGDLYSAFGYFENAEKDYLTVIEKDSLIPQAYYNLAQCLAFRGMDGKAFENYEKAIRLDDEYILAYSGRAAMHLKFEDYQAAIADYSRILKLNQYFLPAYRGRGFARYKTGTYKSAIKDFNFYLEMEPMDSYALYYRGMSQILSNNLYNGCIDLLKSSELGYNEASKALGKYCD
jgi:tetratricopeptide (TPR) repeat protein/LysM repeat protein